MTDTTRDRAMGSEHAAEPDGAEAAVGKRPRSAEGVQRKQAAAPPATESSAATSPSWPRANASYVDELRGVVQHKSAVGAVGDVYEQQADRVADLVVQGRSAATELGAMTSIGGGAPVVQRKPGAGHSTEDLHADLYGDSADAHGSGPDAKPVYLPHYLLSSPFGWEALTSKTPTADILIRWLDHYFFHEPRPLDRDNLDRCDFNGSSAFKVANVANLFAIDAKKAGFTYAEGMVRSVVANHLAPMVEARRQREDAENHGIGPAPYDPGGGGAKPPAKDEDASTQATISWTFVVDPKQASTEQVTGQWTQQLRRNGHGGIELSAGAQVTLSADRSAQQVKVQSIAAVVGGAWVQPFLNEYLQLQAVAQVLTQATLAPGSTASGSTSGSRILGTAQASLGGQIVFTMPGTDRKVQVVLGAAAAVDSSGQGSKNAGIGLQIVF